MKSKILLLLFIFALATNCSNEQPVTDDKQGVEERVAMASIIPGEVVLQKKTAIYIEIPSKHGYLQFDDIKSADEKEQIIKAVYQLYKKEFDDKTLPRFAPFGSRTKSTCGEWQDISPDDPNSAVYHWCCNLSTGVCYRETCDCGYCC